MARRWRQLVGELADAAGPVRDWDVFALETLKPALDRQPGDPVLLAVLDTAARRAEAHGEMRARLAQCRHWPLPALQRDCPPARRRGTAPAGGARAGPLRPPARGEHARGCAS